MLYVPRASILAILLTIESPVAPAFLRIALFQAVLNASVADCLAHHVFDCI